MLFMLSNVNLTLLCLLELITLQCFGCLLPLQILPVNKFIIT